MVSHALGAAEFARMRVGSAALALLTGAYVAYAFVEAAPRAPGVGALVLCPFRLLTGHPCPLCGATRAWHAALHGDWAAAFAAHPVAPLLLPIAIGLSLVGLCYAVLAPRLAPDHSFHLLVARALAVL